MPVLGRGPPFPGSVVPSHHAPAASTPVLYGRHPTAALCPSLDLAAFTDRVERCGERGHCHCRAVVETLSRRVPDLLASHVRHLASPEQHAPAEDLHDRGDVSVRSRVAQAGLVRLAVVVDGDL